MLNTINTLIFRLNIFQKKCFTCYVTCFLFLITSTVPLKIFAQETEIKSSWKDKIYFGGGIGAQIGTLTVLQLAPLVGYKITEELSAGARLNYSYLNDARLKYSSHLYGGSVFGRYRIIPSAFVHLEYDVINLDIYDPIRLTTVRKTGTGLLAGGGFNQQLGGRTTLNLMVLWNLLDDPYYPYANPILRGGIGIGF